MQNNRSTQLQSVFRSRAAMLAVSALILVGLAESFVLRRNTPTVAGLFYASDALVLLFCAAGCFRYSRSAERSLRWRWILLAGGVASAACGYAIAYFQSTWPDATTGRVPQIFCFTTSEALYVLAVVLFFSNAVRSVVIVDMLQALLFVVLRFNLTYDPATHDYANGHLQIALLVALFLFLASVVAHIGAVTSTEQTFLRTLSWFFGLRFVGFFLSNQVAYLWLGSTYSSPLDTIGTTLMALFALFLFVSKAPVRARSTQPGQQRSRSILVRNLMPSFLALVNLMLGLLALEGAKTLASIGVALTVIFYVARTTLLQNQAAAERTALESRNEHLEGLTTRDPLTGIGNRRSILDAFETLQKPGQECGLALLLIDIDHFKEANDRFGHLQGDKVLIALAQKLAQASDHISGGHCARFGGDEFALLLPNVSAWRASSIAEDLRTSFASHRFDGADFGTTVSVGIAIATEGESISLDSLLACADAALYRAKLQGRNCVAAA